MTTNAMNDKNLLGVLAGIEAEIAECERLIEIEAESPTEFGLADMLRDDLIGLYRDAYKLIKEILDI